MKIDRISLPLRSSCLVAGTFVRGPTSCAEGNGRMGPHHPFAPVTSRRELLAARLGQHRNSPIKQIRAQTVDAAYPRLRREFQRLGVNFPLQGLRGPWEKEEATGSDGARKRATDVGVGWSLAGPDSKSKHPWRGRGGGPQGSGPSAAVRRLAPEERAVGGIS